MKNSTISQQQMGWNLVDVIR